MKANTLATKDGKGGFRCDQGSWVVGKAEDFRRDYRIYWMRRLVSHETTKKRRGLNHGEERGRSRFTLNRHPYSDTLNRQTSNGPCGPHRTIHPEGHGRRDGECFLGDSRVRVRVRVRGRSVRGGVERPGGATWRRAISIWNSGTQASALRRPVQDGSVKCIRVRVAVKCARKGGGYE